MLGKNSWDNKAGTGNPKETVRIVRAGREREDRMARI
jgi:hypothetical protein